MRFRPFIPRRDVCDAFDVTGRFGFAIPLAALAELGQGMVSLSDTQGTVLSKADAIPVASTPRSNPGRALVVLHIQKTAGTSLRTALTRSARPCETVFLYPDGFTGLSPDELRAMPAAQRAGFRLLIGHVPFGIADMLPGPADYVTFLRDPLARLRSHYLHHLAISTQAPVAGGVPVAEMVSRGLTDEFDNLMVRMVAGVGVDRVPLGHVGEAEVEQALRHIRTRFRFVGLVEQMPDHHRTLCGLMGVPSDPLATENTCRFADRSAGLDAVDWDRVMHRNRFDTMLYERAQAEGLCGRDLMPHQV